VGGHAYPIGILISAMGQYYFNLRFVDSNSIYVFGMGRGIRSPACQLTCIYAIAILRDPVPKSEAEDSGLGLVSYYMIVWPFVPIVTFISWMR
jgi:hypothetical protein